MKNDDIKLPTNDDIYEAADKQVFEINGDKWSNNDNSAGDNYGSFIAGVKQIIDNLNKENNT